MDRVAGAAGVIAEFLGPRASDEEIEGIVRWDDETADAPEHGASGGPQIGPGDQDRAAWLRLLPPARHHGMPLGVGCGR